MGGNADAYEKQKRIFSAAAQVGTAICGAYTAAKGGNVCFVAGTQVETADGSTAIENIKEGDRVFAANPETGEVAYKKVVQTFVNETDELVDVTIDGKTIRSTPSHPFYSAQKGWTSAINLRAGDILVLNNGEYVVVEQIQHELLENPVTVYNFEVEDYHTYYVSANADSDEFVLVHNSCSGVSRKDLDKAAGDLGYSKVRGQTSHGQPIYYNNRANKSVRYITPDADAHNGGFWKAANSIKNLASKATRTGTFTKNMIWLKD